MPRKSSDAASQAAVDLFGAAEIAVTADTVEVVLVNPDDPVERASFVQRKAKAAAWIANDWTARIAAAAKNIKPFQE
jgi:hypothetical protein